MGHQRWKVIGRTERKKPKHLLGVYEVPDEAVWLAQDIATLEHMQAMMERLQATSFVERSAVDYQTRKAEAYKTLRRLAFIIEALQRVARSNLVDYSDSKARRPQRLTIAEVWQLLLDGFKT